MEQITVDAFFSELDAIYKEAGAPPPLPGGNPMAHALFSGMKSSGGAKVSPGYAKAPAMPGLAGSGTPSMPMPKVQANPFQQQIKVGGFLDSMKNLALKDVGGPKGILQPAGQAVAHGTPKPKKIGDDFKAWQARQAMKTAEEKERKKLYSAPAKLQDSKAPLLGALAGGTLGVGAGALMKDPQLALVLGGLGAGAGLMGGHALSPRGHADVFSDGTADYRPSFISKHLHGEKPQTINMGGAST